MKKTNLLLTFFSIVTIGILTSCETKKCNCDEQEIDPQNLEGYFCYPALTSRPDVALKYPEVVEMLTEYDQTRIKPLENALGYPDSRVNTYDFAKFVQYLNYVEKLSRKAKITITGISFISAAKPNYEGLKRSYQDLIYIPTTTINGEQIPFDAVLSAERDSLVTFKAALAEYGYNWIYNTKEEFEAGKNEENNYRLSITKQNKAGFIDFNVANDNSGAGNTATLAPPF